MNKIMWVAYIVCLTSCASTYEKGVYIDTNPRGATVKIDKETCQIPCDMAVPKSDAYVVQVDKEGYQDEQVHQGLSDWEKNPWIVGGAATAAMGMLAVWPEMIPVVIISSLLSMSIPFDDTVDIIMTAEEKSE